MTARTVEVESTNCDSCWYPKLTPPSQATEYNEYTENYYAEEDYYGEGRLM